MITLYRPAYYTTQRAPEFTGLSIDIKPIDVENGAVYKELDTGHTYRYDAENNKWYKAEEGAEPTPSITVEHITITENGTTTAPDGKAYSPVTVNVTPTGATEPFIEEEYATGDILVSAKLYGYTKIRSYAFYSQPALQQIVLPENLVEIGTNAFYGCSNLTLAELPDSITKIKSRAFENCNHTSFTKLPPMLTSLEPFAFRCPTTIDIIPATVETVGNYALLTKNSTLTFMGTPTTISTTALSESKEYLTTINVPWAEGAVANAPWGATNATINYNYTGE